MGTGTGHAPGADHHSRRDGGGGGCLLSATERARSADEAYEPGWGGL